MPLIGASPTLYLLLPMQQSVILNAQLNVAPLQSRQAPVTSPSQHSVPPSKAVLNSIVPVPLKQVSLPIVGVPDNSTSSDVGNRLLHCGFGMFANSPSTSPTTTGTQRSSQQNWPAQQHSTTARFFCRLTTDNPTQRLDTPHPRPDRICSRFAQPAHRNTRNPAPRFSTFCIHL